MKKNRLNIAILIPLASTLLGPISVLAQVSPQALSPVEADMSAQARSAAVWAVQAMSQCRAIGMDNLPHCAQSPGSEVAAPGIALAAIQMRSDFFEACTVQLTPTRCQSLFEQALDAEVHRTSPPR